MKTKELNYLVEAFKKDSIKYAHIETPETVAEQVQLLRALMNIRMPGHLDETVLKVQDDYLKDRAHDKGIVTLDDINDITSFSSHPYASKLSLWQGDITRLSVDAIVNAANSQMLGCFIPLHTCIDNSIHTYAGVQLRLECAKQMQDLRERHGYDYEQPTAIPMLTKGYNLPAKHVIHVVGPIVQGPLTTDDEAMLAACYTNVLDMCLDNGLKSVAFCCISTGVFHFPPFEAARIAVAAVTKWLEQHEDAMDRIIFNVFKDEDLSYYQTILTSGVK
ncbi:MAG: protein-ADP-ribose hydrolase [Erysipelotrichaceae bacterium]|nr:protein-ADP-ribose hydrolase [Erysipelotrichaceae bacterium]